MHSSRLKSILVSYHFHTIVIVVAILGIGGTLSVINRQKPTQTSHVQSTEEASPTPIPSRSPTPSPKPSPTPTPKPTAGPVPVKAPVVPNLPRIVTQPSVAIAALLKLPLYVEPNTSVSQQAAVWDAARVGDAATLRRMASQPQAKWLGDWNVDPYEEAGRYIGGAAAARALPVVVLYNLPNRDCGSYSSGGASSTAAYMAWIERVAVAAGQQPVMYILEPDSLAEIECFSAVQQTEVYNILRNTTSILKRNKQAAVYLDAGNVTWQTPVTMASRLNSAGVGAADGFSLNVSNFITTPENTVYGYQISALVGGKHFVIDTSRNGLGTDGQWCNPTGRALGTKPTTQTGVPLVDAYLWIKSPGESDGECGRNEPKAGEWWPDYALGLAQRAGY